MNRVPTKESLFQWPTGWQGRSPGAPAHRCRGHTSEQTVIRELRQCDNAMCCCNVYLLCVFNYCFLVSISCR